MIWQNALLTFVLSIMLGTVLSFIIYVPFVLALILLMTIVFVGIAFDMFGVAIAAAQEEPFHAMSADRVAGSGQALWLIRRAERLTNLCNDVIGDVSGTISGAITASLAAALAVRLAVDRNVLTVLAIAVTAAITVGGKAFGKVYALRNPHGVILSVARGLFWLGWPGHRRRKEKRHQRARSGQGRR